MKKPKKRRVIRVVSLVVITLLVCISIGIIYSSMYDKFVRERDFYETEYDYLTAEEYENSEEFQQTEEIDYHKLYLQEENNWLEYSKQSTTTQTACINLLTLLENKEYDEFKTEFVNCYETFFLKDCCYSTIRRVFVSDTSLSLKETKVLLESLSEVLELEKQANNNTAVVRNYALQQEILYHSGRIISAYKFESEIAKYNVG